MPSEDLDHRKLKEYLAAIDKKIAARGNTWDGLSPPERATIDAYFLALEISNGGIEQFFVNPAGDRWRETRDALDMVGAVRLAAMFDEALSVFPDGTPSPDQMERCRQYSEAGEEAESLMIRLTDDYYDLEAESRADSLYEILTRFAIRQLAEQSQEPSPSG